MYNLYVYGMDLADVESVAGWQRYEGSTVLDHGLMETARLMATAHGDDNVVLVDGSLDDGEELDIWSDDYDEYYEVTDDDLYGGNMHCDTYGVCGGHSCPNYFRCQGA